jgi:hypothetical protein
MSGPKYRPLDRRRPDALSPLLLGGALFAAAVFARSSEG